MARDYTQLITAQHKPAAKFNATVALLTGAVGAISDNLLKMRYDFDVDTAIGIQLDVIGLWVGVSRILSVPIANAWFTWNNTDLGWNRANWKGPYESTQGITSLDDETYRSVIKAKIGSNYWDGSDTNLNAISQTALDNIGVNCFVLDNMDMSVTIYILGAPTAAVLELIKRGITPPKAAGVRVAGYILASSPGAPFFALDAPTTAEVAGLDFGAFADPV